MGDLPIPGWPRAPKLAPSTMSNVNGRSWFHGVAGIFHHRQCLPVRLSLGGCSFQFGRTSMWRPRAPHLAHTALLAKLGTWPLQGSVV